MSFHSLPAVLVAAGVITAGASAVVEAAQPQPPEQRAARDPANGAAPVPPLKYRSPFATFTDPGTADVAPWRATNDTVGRIGGWRAYAREAAGKDPAGKGAATAEGHEQHHGAAQPPTPRREQP
jgi:hypothetical protein